MVCIASFKFRNTCRITGNFNSILFTFCRSGIRWNTEGSTRWLREKEVFFSSTFSAVCDIFVSFHCDLNKYWRTIIIITNETITCYLTLAEIQFLQTFQFSEKNNRSWGKNKKKTLSFQASQEKLILTEWIGKLNNCLLSDNKISCCIPCEMFSYRLVLPFWFVLGWKPVKTSKMWVT